VGKSSRSVQLSLCSSAHRGDCSLARFQSRSTALDGFGVGVGEKAVLVAQNLSHVEPETER
jgi:hypothetical protein